MIWKEKGNMVGYRKKSKRINLEISGEERKQRRLSESDETYGSGGRGAGLQSVTDPAV